MRVESVEIYSDASNVAIMRHPGRKFPGVLVQGDTLHSLCQQIDSVMKIAEAALPEEEFLELKEVQERLNGLRDHYKRTLQMHGMPLPFAE